MVRGEVIRLENYYNSVHLKEYDDSDYDRMSFRQALEHKMHWWTTYGAGFSMQNITSLLDYERRQFINYDKQLQINQSF